MTAPALGKAGAAVRASDLQGKGQVGSETRTFPPVPGSKQFQTEERRADLPVYPGLLKGLRMKKPSQVMIRKSNLKSIGELERRLAMVNEM